MYEQLIFDDWKVTTINFDVAEKKVMLGVGLENLLTGTSIPTTKLLEWHTTSLFINYLSIPKLQRFNRWSLWMDM